MSDVLLVAQQLRRTVPGGIGTYVRGLVQGLGRLAESNDLHGDDVTLYAGRPATRPDPLAELGLPLLCSPLPAAALSRAWRAKVVDVPGGFGVVHATSLDQPAARRCRLAVTVHDLAWRSVPEAFPAHGRRWHDAALDRALRRADALVVPSDAVATALTAAGARADLVVVIPHGSDHLPVPDEVGTAAVLGRLGVEGDFFLCVGTLEPRKNLERLLAAYQQARAAMEDPLPLVVVGPPGWGSSASAGSPGLGAKKAGDGVRFAGNVAGATLAGLYGRAKVVVYVPLLEGFGFPALEAMASGTPVVASPMPSTGSASLEVDPSDVSSIARAMVEVSTDNALRAELVASGTAHAAAHTWQASAESHLALWRRLS